MNNNETDKRVAVVKGDGVGPEVIESALQVLEKAGAQLQWEPVNIGYSLWEQTGKAITPAEIALIKKCRCVLLGAITSPPDPEYKSVLLTIRKELDLYANIRPLKNSQLDIIVVRENTEGLYSGIETKSEEKATTLRVVTRQGSRRIAEKACQLASHRKKLTIVHKANVLKSDRLFLKVCRETAEEWGVPCEDMLVDAAAYNFVVDPRVFDVIVTTNLFGDILSDLAAGVVGGLGLCPSANLGEKYALFEPIHGSAPGIAGKGIANPIGAIRAAASMMDWLGQREKAIGIRDAVQQTLADNIKTPDLGGKSNTKEVTQAVLKWLG